MSASACIFWHEWGSGGGDGHCFYTKVSYKIIYTFLCTSKGIKSTFIRLYKCGYFNVATDLYTRS